MNGPTLDHECNLWGGHSMAMIGPFWWYGGGTIIARTQGAEEPLNVPWQMSFKGPQGAWHVNNGRLVRDLRLSIPGLYASAMKLSTVPIKKGRGRCTWTKKGNGNDEGLLVNNSLQRWHKWHRHTHVNPDSRGVKPSPNRNSCNCVSTGTCLSGPAKLPLLFSRNLQIFVSNILLLKELKWQCCMLKRWLCKVYYMFLILANCIF